jgi:alginate production protein
MKHIPHNPFPFKKNWYIPFEPESSSHPCIKALILVILAAACIKSVSADTSQTHPHENNQRISTHLFDSAKGKSTQEPFDPNAPPKPSILLAPDLYLGGQLNLTSKTNRNFALGYDPGDPELGYDPDDAFSYLETYLSLAFLYEPNPYFQVYANPIVRKRVAFEERENKIQDPTLELNLAFLSFNKLIDGTTFSFGRQRFKDPRRWIWGENLDAAKINYQHDNFSFEFSASRKNMFMFDVLNADPEDSGDRFINYYAYLNYELNKKTDIALFVLYQDDQTHDSTDHQKPVFVGIQSEGELIKHLDYWFQGALVRGSDSGKTIRGEGMDFGFTYQFEHDLKPSITLGYAYGSGDGDPSDNVDKAFRQSRFQDNEDKFNGVVRLKYYGELLDPRLSNLKVLTSGLGIRPSRRTSFDLVYHYFRQEYPGDRISGDNLDVDPTGLSKDLGSELDFVAGYQEIKNLNTKLVLGYFWPGRAFPKTSNDGAFLAEFQVRYSF